MNLINTKSMFYIYLTLMSLIYAAYVWLFNYRMNMSEVWLSKSIITLEDSAMIGQLGRWSERFEILFIFLLVGMGILCFLKRRSDRSIFGKFFIVNAFLALGILVLSLVLNQITSLSFMDLVLPLTNVVGIVILLSIYLFLEWFIKHRSSVSRA